MEAYPTGILPRASDAGKGQLHRTGGWMKTKLGGFKPLQQQATNAKPKRITTGKKHRWLRSCQSSGNCFDGRRRVISGNQLLPAAGGIGQAAGGCHQCGLLNQKLQGLGQIQHPTRICADHMQAHGRIYIGQGDLN